MYLSLSVYIKKKRKFTVNFSQLPDMEEKQTEEKKWGRKI